MNKLLQLTCLQLRSQKRSLPDRQTLTLDILTGLPEATEGRDISLKQTRFSNGAAKALAMEIKCVMESPLVEWAPHKTEYLLVIVCSLYF